MQSIVRTASLVLCAALLSTSAGASTIYVRYDAPGPAHDGTTWVTAYRAVQPAINAAASGDEVWVAKGTYTGAITMKTGVALYGGFAGTETARDQRDWRLNETIVDGTTFDGDQKVSASVVTFPAGATEGTILSGFTVTKGSGTPVTDAAGTFNWGGGIYVQGGNPVIEENVVANNRASYGGGIYVKSGNAAIRRNRIVENAADAFHRYYPDGMGGGIYADGPVSVVGNVIAGNFANYDGSAVYLMNGGACLNNSIVRNGFGETWDSYGGLLGLRNVTDYANNIVAYNGSTANGSKVGANYVYGNGSDDNGTIAPPKFMDLENGDYHLMKDSPCRDTADDAYLTTVGPLDMDGEIRKSGARIDYGADEVVPFVGSMAWFVQPSKWYVNSAMAPAPAVTFRDAYGIPCAFNGTVTASIKPGTGAEGATLSGATATPRSTVPAHPGLHVFWSLSIDKPGTGYVVVPAARTLYGELIAGPESAPFDIVGGAIALRFDTQPAGSTPRVPLDPAPVVAAIDFQQTVAPDFTGPVTLSIKPGTGTPGARLLGTTTVNAVNGLATFSGVSIDRPGSGYVLVASNPLLTAGESKPVSLSYVPIKVSPTGHDISSGATWATAFRTVQKALDAAADEGGGEVWVAKGTYAEKLTMKAPTALYGGFAGTETSREERDIAAHPTVLDGEDKRRVLRIPALPGPFVVDGFTLTRGYVELNEDLPVLEGSRGAGIYSEAGDLTVAHCAFTNNHAYNIVVGGPSPGSYANAEGGGLYQAGGRFRVHGSTFAGNLAGGGAAGPGGGGAIFCRDSTAEIAGNVFSSNFGSLYTENSALDLAGNLFRDGTGDTHVIVQGGNALRAALVRNNTFIGRGPENFPEYAALGAWYAGTVTVVNNVFAYHGTAIAAGKPDGIHHNLLFGNTTNYEGFSYPAGQDPNLLADPLFVDAANKDYRLRADSPAIDAGDDSFVSTGEQDLDGNPRRVGAHVDIGAYEFMPPGAVTMQDVFHTMKVAGGLEAASAPAEPVDLTDALAILRKVSGIDPNP